MFGFQKEKGRLAGAGLPFFLFAFFVSCFLLHPSFTMQPHGADDAMRLLQVRSLMDGQSWFDFSVLRLGRVGDSTILPWSRLPDLPLLFLGKFFSLDVAAFIVPLCWLGLLLWISSAMSRPLVSRAASFWAPLFLLSCTGSLLYQFKPMRVDHHGVFLVLAALGYTLLQRMILRPRLFLPPFLLACVCALMLWVGAEAYPFLLCLGSILAFFVIWQGGVLQRTVALFGLFFGLSAAVLLPAVRLPSQWTDHAVLWFSGASVVFALLY